MGFPEDKCGGVRLGVTKLESEAGILRKVRVRGDKIARTVLVGKLVDRDIVTIFVLVVNVSMSVRERTTLDVLATDTHVIALINQSGEG